MNRDNKTETYMNVIQQTVYRTKNVPIKFSDIELGISKSEHFNYIHWHESIEIMFFKEGIVENIIDNKFVKENADDIVVINANTLHGTRSLTQNSKYYALVIDKDTCIKYGFSLPDYYIKSEINDVRLASLINEIKQEFIDENEHFEAMVTAKTLELLTILFRDYAFKKHKTNNNSNIEMVKQGIEYIKNNYANDITVGDVANSIGYSKYHFCRTFKEITKCTVSSYINILRVNKAYKYIAENGYSIGKAASECGFGDISYFTKVFKKYVGVLPSKIKSKEIQLDT